MYPKRLSVCLLGGMISAVICFIGGQVIHGWPAITWHAVAVTLANRLLLGFVIGISSWHINYLLHGAILGLLVSLTVSIGFLPTGFIDLLIYTSAGVLYGIFIEFLSTRVFRAPMALTRV